MQTAKASRKQSSLSGKRVPRAAFPSGCLAAQTKRWVEGEKVGLKLNIQKNQIMSYIPITSWQIDGETMETVRGFIFFGSKIMENGDYSQEIKRCLLLGRKAMTNLDSILKSRDIYFPNKGLSSQSYGFSSSHVWM